jgi:hypothetical protein
MPLGPIPYLMSRNQHVGVSPCNRKEERIKRNETLRNNINSLEKKLFRFKD